MPTFHSKTKHTGLGFQSQPNSKVPFKSTTKTLPPNDKSILLIWEDKWGYDVIESFLVHQHVIEDIKTLGYARITHWLILEKEKGDFCEREKNSSETAGKERTKKRPIILKRKKH